MYGAIERWAMARFGAVEVDGSFYPRIFGLQAHRVFQFFWNGGEQMVKEVISPEGGSVWEMPFTSLPIDKMPKATESQFGRMVGLEMHWRPYWANQDPTYHGPYVEFWNTLRDFAAWIDTWKPQSHRLKSLTLPVAPDPEGETPYRLPEAIIVGPKKKKTSSGIVILILLGLWLWSRKGR